MASLSIKAFSVKPIVLMNRMDGEFSQEYEDTLLNFAFHACQATWIHSELARLATTDGLKIKPGKTRLLLSCYHQQVVPVQNPVWCPSPTHNAPNPAPIPVK